MTEPFTERFHRRVNWPPGSWHPPDRGSTLTWYSYPPDFPQSGYSSRGHRFIPIQFLELILWPNLLQSVFTDAWTGPRAVGIRRIAAGFQLHSQDLEYPSHRDRLNPTAWTQFTLLKISTYDRTLHRASSPMRELASKQLASAGSLTSKYLQRLKVIFIYLMTNQLHSILIII